MESSNNLEVFRTELGLKKREFAATIDVPEGNYGKMERGEITISPATILKFQKKYPSINPEWWAYKKGAKTAYGDINLLVGRGKRNNAKALGSLDQDDNSPIVEISPGRYRMKVKLVPEYAYASYPMGYADQEYIEDLPLHEIVVNQLHFGHYQAFEVSGDSMNDGSINSIPDGSIVTGREISQKYWKNKFHTHKFSNFVFVHMTEGITVKRIANQDLETGNITLNSLNPNKDEYPDFTWHMDEILQIFNVVKRDLPN